MISPFSSSRPPSADKTFSDVRVRLRTNDQIRELIAEKIARFRSSFLSQKKSAGDELPQTSTPFKDQQHPNPAAVRLNNPKAKQPVEEDSGGSRSKSVKTSSKRKACPQVLSEVAATFTKNQEESPVVSTSSSVKTFDKLTENCQSSETGRKDSKPSNHLGSAPTNQTEQVFNEVEPNSVAETPHCPTLEQPQSDDISDEDASQRSDKLQSTKKSVMKTSSTSTRNSELDVKTQINSKLGQELVPPETDGSCSCFVQTGDKRSCPKCDCERDFRGQTNSLDELESQLDDDDWEVIPLSILNLTFEQAGNPENASQDSKEELSSRSKPVPASAFSKLEVFDTLSEQEQAGRFGPLSFVEPSSRSSHKREPQTLKRRASPSEHEDSCDTDYSSDYSSGPESNHLTVSKRLVRSLSAPVGKKSRENGVEESIIIHDSDSESEDDAVATERGKASTSSVDASSTPTEEPVQNEARKKSSKEKNVIIILSDSDDDSTDSSIRAKDVLELEDGDETEVMQNPKPSADVPKPKPDHKPDPKTSRQTTPGNKDKKKDYSTKKLETKDRGNDLKNSGSGLSAKSKNVKKPASPRSDQRHEHFSEKASSSSTRRMSVQTSAPRQRSHSYESSMSYPPFTFRKSLSLTAPRSIHSTSHARAKVHDDWEQKHIPRKRRRRIPSRYK